MADELIARHPRLWHLAEAEGAASIRRLGLLPAADLVALFGGDPVVLRQRRAGPVVLRHPEHGVAVLNDNGPLPMAALASCLDDGLQAEDWLGLLNARVFLFPERKKLEALRSTPLNNGRRKVVFTVNTETLVRAHADRIEITPFNTGYALRKPVRRGHGTFQPLGAMSFAGWRGLRGGTDRVAEVIVRGAVPDFMDHVLDESAFA